MRLSLPYSFSSGEQQQKQRCLLSKPGKAGGKKKIKSPHLPNHSSHLGRRPGSESAATGPEKASVQGLDPQQPSSPRPGGLGSPAVCLQQKKVGLASPHVCSHSPALHRDKPTGPPRLGSGGADRTQTRCALTEPGRAPCKLQSPAVASFSFSAQELGRPVRELQESRPGCTPAFKSPGAAELAPRLPGHLQEPLPR